MPDPLLLTSAEELSLNVLALIHGDAWIKESGLEGGTETKNLSFIIPFLSWYRGYLVEAQSPAKEIENIDSVITHLAELQSFLGLCTSETNFKEFNERVSGMASRLRPGETFLLPGGWRGNPYGHAMLYEIERQADGKFSFTVYNTGAGIEYHQSISISHKTKFLTALKIRDINPEDILNENVIRAIFELKSVQPSAGEEREPEYVYEGFLPFLKGRREVIDLPETEFTTPQRSGTCSMKVINAYIKSKLGGDIKLYKKFKFHEKMQSLKQFLSEEKSKRSQPGYEEDYEKNEQIKMVLEGSIEKLSRSIYKLISSGVITQKEMLDFISLREEIHSFTKDLARPEDRLQVLETDFKDEIQVSEQYEKHGCAWFLTYYHFKPEFPTDQTFEPASRVASKTVLTQLTAANILSTLQHCLEEVQDLKDKGQERDIYPFLQTVLGMLPVPSHESGDNFWNTIRPEDIIPVRDTIFKLTQEFYRSLHQHESTYNQEDAFINTANSTMIAFLLSQKAPDTKGLLADRGLIIFEEAEGILEAIHKRHFMLDAFQLDRVKKLLEYCKGQPQERLCFDADAFKHHDRFGETIYEMRREDLNDGNAEYVLLKALVPQELEERYTEEEKGKLELISDVFCDPEYNPDDAEASRPLLPVWYHQLRDMRSMTSFVYLHTLTSEVSVTLEPKKIGDAIRISSNRPKIAGNSCQIKKIRDASFVDDSEPTVKGLIGLITHEVYTPENEGLISLFQGIVPPEILPVQDLRYLALIRSSGDLQVHDALDFFTKNFELLRERGYQKYSLVCFFKETIPLPECASSSINDVLQKYPGVIKGFEKLLDYGIEECGTDVGLHIYLTTLYYKLKSHVEFLNSLNKGPALAVKEYDFVDGLNRLFNKTPPLDEKSKVEIAKTILKTKTNPNPSDKDLREILFYSIFLAESSSSKYVLTDEEPLDMQKLLYENRNRISEFLSRNPSALNEILHELNIIDRGINLQFSSETEGLIFRSDTQGYTIDITDGRICKDGLPLNGLPREILESKKYRELFGEEVCTTIYSGGYFRNLKDTVRFCCDQKAYEKKRQELYDGDEEIYDLDEATRIRSKVLPGSEVWYEYIGRESFYKLLSLMRVDLSGLWPRSGDDEYTCWISTEKERGRFEFVIVNKKSGHPCYRMDFNDSVMGVKLAKLNEDGKEDGYVLQDIYSDTSGPFASRILQFASKREAFVFKNTETGKIFIEMPDLGLTFESQDEKFLLKGNPEFCLSEDQDMPLLGNMKAYLVIENPAKQKFILLRGDNCSADGTTKRLPPVMCKLSENGKDIVPMENTSSSHIVLALNFLQGRNYKHCIKHLRKAWQDHPYSEEEVKILSDFIKMQKVTKDHSPEFYGVISFVAHLLTESIRSTPENHPNYEKIVKIFEEALGKMQKFIEGSIEVSANIPSYMRLEGQKELEMLERLSTVAASEVIKRRTDDLRTQREHTYYNEARTVQATLFVEILGDSEAGIKPGSETYGDSWERGYQERQSASGAILLERPFLTLSEQFPDLYFEAIRCREGGREMKKNFLLKLNYIYRRLGAHQRTPYNLKIFEALTYVCLCPGIPTQGLIEKSGYTCFPAVLKVVEDILKHPNYNKTNLLRAALEFFGIDMPPQHKSKEDGRVIPPDETKYTDYALPVRPAGAPYFPDMPLEEGVGLFRCREEVVADASISFPRGGAQGSKIEDRLHQKLARGLEATSVERRVSYSIDPANLHILKDDLDSRLREDNREADSLLKEILESLNTVPDDPDGRGEHITRFGRLSEKIKLNDCLLFLLQKNSSILTEKNKFLTPEIINENFHKLIRYFMLKTRANQIKNAQRILNKVLAEETPNPLLIQALGEEISQKRSFDPYVNPEYLVFEYKAEMIIREKNIQILEQLKQSIREQPDSQTPSPQTKDLIYQLIMGGGKTKVILPLLGLALADEEKLVTILVPASLYETNSNDLRWLLQEFGKKVYHFRFERSYKYTIDQLRALESRFEQIQKTRGCMIAPPESVQSLMLKYVETLRELKQPSTDTNVALKEELTERATIMQKMLRRLHEKGLVILDEADTILNCRRELNYSIDVPTHYQQVRWEFACEILSKLESMGFKVNSDGIPEARYTNVIRPRLANELAKEFYEVLKGFTVVSAEQIRGYITEASGSEGFIEALKANLEGNPHCVNREEILDRLILAKEYLTHILPFTLAKKCSVNYGRAESPRYELAVPYEGNRRPSRNSEFGHPDILIAFTLQNAFINGLTITQTKKLVKFLQKEKTPEDEEPGMESYKSKLIKEFSRIIGRSVLTVDSENTATIEKLHSEIGKRTDIIGYYYNTLVFPEMNNFEYKLSSNPLDIAGSMLFRRRMGFTGTPNNSIVYPANIEVKDDPEEDGKVLRKLLNPSVTDVAVVAPREGEETMSPQLMLDRLPSVANLAEYRAFIDCGSHFRGIENAIAAKMILEKLKDNTNIDGIIYFDDTTNELTVLTKQNQRVKYNPSRCPPERYFTYYDQYHTTGTDIKQAPDAKAFLSVGRNLSTRDIFQSAMRMRALGKGQTITFVVPPSIPDLRSPQEIISRAEQDEARQLTRDTLFSAKQKIDQVQREADWRMIISKEIAEITPADFSSMVTKTESSLWETCRSTTREVETERYLSGLVERRPQVQHAELREIVRGALTYLPDRVAAREGENLGLEMQREQQQEQQQEQQREVEKERESEFQVDYGVTHREERAFGSDRLRTTSEFAQLFSERETQDGVSIMPINSVYDGLCFDDNIFMTDNFLRTINSEGGPPLNKYMKTAHFYLEVWERGAVSPKILLLSRRDAAELFLKIRQTTVSEDVQVCLRNCDGELVSGTPEIKSEAPGAAVLQTQKEISRLRALAQIKFLQGETRYVLPVHQQLEAWLRSASPEINLKRKAFFETLRISIFSKKTLGRSQLDRTFTQTMAPGQAGPERRPVSPQRMPPPQRQQSLPPRPPCRPTPPAAQAPPRGPAAIAAMSPPRGRPGVMPPGQALIPQRHSPPR